METTDDVKGVALLVSFVGRHLAWLIAAVAVAYAGYTSGLTRIADLEARAQRGDAQRADDHQFLECVVLNIRLMQAGTNKDAGCSMEVPK